MYPRFPGRHKLHRFEDTGLEKCVGCSLCAAACPADCIRVVAAENDPADRVSAGERYAAVYEINMSRCIFCGYCEVACPFDAITMGHEYELADYDRGDLIFTKEMLLASRSSAPLRRRASEREAVAGRADRDPAAAGGGRRDSTRDAISPAQRRCARCAPARGKLTEGADGVRRCVSDFDQDWGYIDQPWIKSRGATGGHDRSPPRPSERLGVDLEVQVPASTLREATWCLRKAYSDPADAMREASRTRSPKGCPLMEVCFFAGRSAPSAGRSR